MCCTHVFCQLAPSGTKWNPLKRKGSMFLHFSKLPVFQEEGQLHTGGGTMHCSTAMSNRHQLAVCWWEVIITTRHRKVMRKAKRERREGKSAALVLFALADTLVGTVKCISALTVCTNLCSKCRNLCTKTPVAGPSPCAW